MRKVMGFLELDLGGGSFRESLLSRSGIGGNGKGREGLGKGRLGILEIRVSHCRWKEEEVEGAGRIFHPACWVENEGDVEGRK